MARCMCDENDDGDSDQGEYDDGDDDDDGENDDERDLKHMIIITTTTINMANTM